MTRWLAGILAVAVLGGVSACDETAPDLAEWTVADHNHQTKTSRAEQRSAEVAVKDTRAAPSKRNIVAEVTWTNQCVNCHGKRGRGDGPQSTMVKAKDLSNPEWQDSVTDEALAKVIREGKDKMPAFNLPDSVIQGLVEQIRKWRRKTKDDPGQDDDDDAERTPAAAAPAPAAADTQQKAPPAAPSSAADGAQKSAASAP